MEELGIWKAAKYELVPQGTKSTGEWHGRDRQNMSDMAGTGSIRVTWQGHPLWSCTQKLTGINTRLLHGLMEVWPRPWRTGWITLGSSPQQHHRLTLLTPFSSSHLQHDMLTLLTPFSDSHFAHGILSEQPLLFHRVCDSQQGIAWCIPTPLVRWRNPAAKQLNIHHSKGLPPLLLISRMWPLHFNLFLKKDSQFLIRTGRFWGYRGRKMSAPPNMKSYKMLKLINIYTNKFSRNLALMT